ncbi:hypothetical protein [Streptomyces sp. KLOTTS4A1]|uniref:hypothetical protein n=1 Tax=Streptomyces sp. KLOTTS4A1 TaxID=3390996 RepID=UPI0039F4FBA1
MAREVCARVVGLVSVLLTLGACSSGGGSADDRQQGYADACTHLLGDEGMRWLRSGIDDVEFNEPGSMKFARSHFRKQVGDYQPGDVPYFTDSGVCGAYKPAADGPSEKRLSLRYGASPYPFDWDFATPDENDPGAEVVTVTPEVKLVYGPHRRMADSTHYRIYVKCGVAGAAESSIDEIPLQGSLVDTLTGDSSHRAHLKYLLHSSKVVVDSFGCTNKPEIPTNVPASVSP